MKLYSETTIMPSARKQLPMLSIVVWLACVAPGWGARAAEDDDVDDDVTVKAQQQSPRKIDAVGLDNAWEVMPGVFSGGEPPGEKAFATLAQLGVATIVSVDGARPAVELARAHGMRYVHIPVGYDGLSETAVAALARVARECVRPIYVHCHHGRHRGPAAAVVLSMCDRDGDFDVADAVHVMQIIGTGAEYRGLWKSVRGYDPSAKVSRSPELVEVAEVDDLPAAMARLDRAWDQVAKCQAAGWQSPPDHPDISPSHVALLLLEALKESRRTVAPTQSVAPTRDEKSQAGLRDELDQAVALAGSLNRAVAAGRREQADVLVEQLRKSCRGCHEDFRN